MAEQKQPPQKANNAESCIFCLESALKSSGVANNDVVKKSLQAFRQALKDEDNQISVPDKVVTVLQELSVFTGLDVAQTAVKWAGALGELLPEPYGVVVGGLCSVFGTVLSLFGGDEEKKEAKPITKEDIAEVMRGVIQNDLPAVVAAVFAKAMEDEKEHEKEHEIELQIQNDFKLFKTKIRSFSLLLSDNNGVIPENAYHIIQDEGYARIGDDSLTKLRDEIKTFAVSDKIDDAVKVVKYIYYYCMVALMRRMLLGLQCCLLHVNNLTTDIKFAVLPEWEASDDSDKQLLNFLAAPGEHCLVYRFMQTDEVLTLKQRGLIYEFRKLCGCDEMEGYYAELFHLKNRMYANGVSSARCGYSVREEKVGYRIFGDPSGCYIYNILSGRYILSDPSQGGNFEGEVKVTKERRGLWSVTMDENGALIFSEETKERLYLRIDEMTNYGHHERLRILGKCDEFSYWNFHFVSKVGQEQSLFSQVLKKLN